MKKIFSKFSFVFVLFSFLTFLNSYGQFLYISGGNQYSMVVCQDGNIKVWGTVYDANGQEIRTPTPVVVPVPVNGLKFDQADAGSGYHIVALDCEKKVWGYGRNDFGQLGIPVSTTHSGVAVPVTGIGGAAGSQLGNVKFVSGLNNASLALLENGEVVAWGENGDGELGRGTTVSSHIPDYVKIDATTRLTNIKQVEGGDQNGYALTNNGLVYSWGSGADWALGRNTTNGSYAGLVTTDATGTPLRNIISIAAGDRHVIALAADGSVWSWGGNWAPGQLGNGTTGNQQYAARVSGVGGTGFLSGATYIAAGQGSSMVVVNGNVVTFGANAIYTPGGAPTAVGGNLGQGSVLGTASSPVPNYVVDCNGNRLSNIRSVSDGDAVTFAINFNNEVFVMGGNTDGNGVPNGVLGTGDLLPRGCATKLTETLKDCRIADPCPAPNLGPDLSVCSKADLPPITLSTTLYQSYTYKWYYRVTPQGTFNQIAGATTNTLKPTELGQYMVEVLINQSNCAQCTSGRDTITVDQPSINAGGFCKEQSLTFRVPAPANGIYKWYKSAAGQDSLTPRGNPFTIQASQITPVISGEDTVYSLYFEDKRVYSGTAGPSTTISAANVYDRAVTDTDRNRLFFNVNTNISINAVWLRLYNYFSNGPTAVTITVSGPNYPAFSVTQSLNVPSASSAPGAAIRFPLTGLPPLRPGTNYTIQMTGSSNANVKMSFFDNSPNVVYPSVSTGDIAGFLTITGLQTRADGGNVPNSTIGILNWEISGTAGGTCGRTRVSFTKDCPCNAPDSLKISSITGATAFCRGISSSLTLLANPTPVTPVIDPRNYLYKWYVNGNEIFNNPGNTISVNSTSNPVTYTVRVGHTSLTRSKCFKEANLNITIQEPMTGNTISGTDTICENLPYMKKIGGAAPTGGTGEIHYAWQLSTVSATTGFTDLQKDSTHITPGQLSGTTWFRRVATRGVCTNTSNTIQIAEEPVITPGTFEGTAPRICSGSALPVLSYTDPSGPAFKYNFKYVWQYSYDNTSWISLSETGPKLQNPPLINRSTYFRRIATSRCSATSQAVFIKVDTSVTSNVLSSNLSQTICTGAPAATIVGNVPVGGVNPPAYKWQSSGNAAGTFTDIPQTNTKDYTPGVVTSTTYYKRVVTSTGACQNNTSSLTAAVIVDPKVNPGSIRPGQVLICSGTAPVLENVTPASGGTAPYTYKWQYLNGSTWTYFTTSNTAGPVTAPSVTDPSLTSVLYRRVVSSTACGDTSAPVTVNLTGKMRPGSIVPTDTEICAGEAPGIINSTGPAQGGTGNNIIYMWQYSTDRVNWINIPTATGTSYTPEALPGTTYFRRQATNGTGTCDTVQTDFVTVSQYQQLLPGNIQNGDTSVCDGSSALIRETVPASLGGPDKSYRWLIARAPFTVFKDTNVNSRELLLLNLHQNVRVRRITVDNCGEATAANTYEVIVFPKDTVSISLKTDLGKTYCGDSPLPVSVSVKRAGARRITWFYNGVETLASGDSVFVVNNPKDGDRIKVIVFTDPLLICTNQRTESEEFVLNIDAPITGNEFTNPDYQICLGDAIPVLNENPVAGGLANPQYQWLSSPTQTGPFQNIPGAVNEDYHPAGITATTFFKRVVTSTGVCKMDTSESSARIYIDTPVTPGTIQTSDVCGSDTIRVTSTLPSTGGDNGYTYSWEFATKLLNASEPGGWRSIPGYTGDTLKISSKDLDQTSRIPYFGFRRRVVSNGGVCDTVSNIVWMKICLKPIVFGPITDTICINTPSEVIKAISRFDFSPNEGGALVLNGTPAKTGIKTKTVRIDSRDSSFVYVPADDSLGFDTVSFSICDTTTNPVQCTQKQYIVKILLKNFPPVVKPELFSTYKKQPITGQSILNGNDSDPNNDTLYAYPSIDSLIYYRPADSSKTIRTVVRPSKIYRDSLLIKPKHGEITMLNNGSFIYQPKLDFPADKKPGYDTAVFWVCDYSYKEYCNEFFCRKDTVVFEVKPYRIFVPEGFSPNGDNVNDFFVIRSEIPIEMSLKVYNRWGNLVYENEDYKNDWDGRANRGLVIGDGLPDGTYYLYIDIHDEERDEPEFNYITISR